MKGILLDSGHDVLIDLKHDFDGMISSGLTIGDLTYQNQELLILSEKGEIKEAPMRGVCVMSYLDDESPEDLFREIRAELKKDGMNVRKVGFDGVGNIAVEANY